MIISAILRSFIDIPPILSHLHDLLYTWSYVSYLLVFATFLRSLWLRCHPNHSSIRYISSIFLLSSRSLSIKSWWFYSILRCSPSNTFDLLFHQSSFSSTVRWYDEKRIIHFEDAYDHQIQSNFHQSIPDFDNKLTTSSF